MGSQSSGISAGLLTPPDTWGRFNELSFIIRQWINKLQTATLVKVVSCTNEGGLSPVGFVDVLPLVNQIDGQGNATPHATIFGLPYLRMQGGSNAVVMDPKPGDIGVAIFASRDISKVKSTQAQANPGSLRSYDFSDGMYLGGMLNGTPTQYIQFTDAGITIVSPTLITLQAPSVVIDGALSTTEGSNATIAGAIAASGDVISGAISLQTHVHTSSTPGTPTSEPIG